MKKPFLSYQAQSFFSVFEMLDEILNNTDYNLLRYYAPWITNGAFSAELCLKSILAENEISYNKEHRLFNLFILLPKKYQDEILYKILLSPYKFDKENFTKNIILISDAFVEWRYAYEGNAAAIDSGFFKAWVIAISAVHKLHYGIELVKNEVPAITVEEFDIMVQQNREQKYNEQLKKT